MNIIVDVQQNINISEKITASIFRVGDRLEPNDSDIS
jgi:hypothetical protein